MFKKLKGTTCLYLLIFAFIAIFLAGTAWAGNTNLDMLTLEPAHTDDYSLKLKNRDGTDKFTFSHDGVFDIIGPVIEGGVTRHTCSGTTVEATSSYNTWFVTVITTSESGVTLPEITSALEGFKITFKLVGSGASRFLIKPYKASASAGDYIESTQGTMTAQIDYLLDAAGDLRTWKASYISGSTNIWYLMVDER